MKKKNTFLPNGFEIIECSSLGIDVVHNINLWHYNQHPLNGVSRASIRLGDGQISLEGELGGVNKIIKYITVFIVSLFVFLSYLYEGMPLGIMLLVTLAPFVPWVVVIPLMGMWLRKRARGTLDTLLRNMIMSAR